MGSFDNNKQRISGDIQGVYRYFVRLRVLTGEALQETKSQVVVNSDEITGRGIPQVQAEFLDYLARLYDYYKYKFDGRKDIELPDFAKDEAGGIEETLNVRDLTFKQGEVLYNRIARLQEELGHLSIERGTYKEDGI